MSKKDEKKPQPHLFYTSALWETVKVREYGIQKHGGPEDWKTTQPHQHYDAAIRHIRAVIDGEQLDPDTGLHHLAAAICNCMFEIERYYNGRCEICKVNLSGPGRTICGVCETRGGVPRNKSGTIGAVDIIEQKDDEYLCVVCKKNIVDVNAGMDTCPDCLDKQ